jgi:hypothetical protein
VEAQLSEALGSAVERARAEGDAELRILRAHQEAARDAAQVREKELTSKV